MTSGSASPCCLPPAGSLIQPPVTSPVLHALIQQKVFSVNPRVCIGSVLYFCELARNYRRSARYSCPNEEGESNRCSSERASLEETLSQCQNSERERPLIFVIIKLLYFITSIFQKRGKTISLSCKGNS